MLRIVRKTPGTKIPMDLLRSPALLSYSSEGLLLKLQQAKSQNPGIHFQTNQNLSISGMNVFHL
jgi:hypothetical protein